MKKLFVVDEDEKFQTLIKSLCKKETVELHIYTSGMEVLPRIEDEQPDLIFVNLELSDIDDFVMYDLMKKADMKPPIPVLITYAEQSEKDLPQYKRMKFRPEGYHKKPLSDTDITALLTRYLGGTSDSNGSSEETESEPSKDENVDLDIDLDLDEASIEEEVIFAEVFSETEFVQEPLTQVSAEEQPPPVEKLDPAKTQLKSGPEIMIMEFEKKLKELEKEKIDLVKKVDQLTDQLTNKERESEEKDQKFEKKLKELHKEVDHYKKRNDQLEEVLQKAVSLTKNGDKG